MEVAFFTDSFAPTRDGVATVVSGLARTLQRLGHPVRVFAPNPVAGAAPYEVEMEGVRVVRVRSLPVPMYGEYRWGFFPFSQLRGERFADSVDVIHLHTPGILGSTGFLAARRFAKPLVGTFHTNVWEMRESFPSTFWTRLFFRAAWWYTLGTYWRCDVTTAPTTVAAEALTSHASKAFHRPVEVIPNGIEVERFRPGIREPNWRERCGLSEAPLVTYLGRLTADKGIHRFLDGVAQAQRRVDLSAIIGGSGPEAANVRDRLAQDPVLRSHVRYVGPVAEEEKAALLAQSDLFVLPSTSDTASVALLEAMASGATCVASDVGGPADLIDDHRTGRLVPIRTEGALAEVIVELVERTEERRRLATAAVEWVRRSASIEATARRFISLYEHLLTERRSSRGANLAG